MSGNNTAAGKRVGKLQIMLKQFKANNHIIIYTVEFQREMRTFSVVSAE